MSSPERHRIAVAQSLAHAQQSADRGDFGEALEWLQTVEAVDRALPEGWDERRELWRRLALERAVHVR